MNLKTVMISAPVASGLITPGMSPYSSKQEIVPAAAPAGHDPASGVIVLSTGPLTVLKPTARYRGLEARYMRIPTASNGGAFSDFGKIENDMTIACVAKPMRAGKNVKEI